ncbi:electron transport complex protein RnfC [Treponema bryantii]|uniref:Ion-translocating oxidoreductase complex subunit C n=1 Tax=Treponema bryantii TaxID=163 RepID=A0A1H9IN01_9SPIR|nr:electron transport complex subunit RsxC [Treponema bryantii]SEQ75872.1 electron transport complex protein RnfC [Treponema bryantii]
MRAKTFKGGIHPKEYKELSNQCPITPAFPASKTVTIPVTMGGAPNQPLVKVGDEVAKGQIIASGEGFMNCPVHSSVSGKVKKIQNCLITGNGMAPCIIIEADDAGRETLLPVLNPFETTKEQALARIKEAGIVGMGGASFPAHVKLNPPADKIIDYVLINAAECEPYLTCDERTMLEQPAKVIDGLAIVMHIINGGKDGQGHAKGIIVLEDNKEYILPALENEIAAAGYSDKMSVCLVKTKYPQGAEKFIVSAATGREIPSAKLPADAGCVICNVGSVCSISDAFRLGMPLVERSLTISGGAVEKPVNLRVPVGTIVSDLMPSCFTLKSEGASEPVKIISGGPMMGFAMASADFPVAKGTSGVTFLTEKETFLEEESQCISCGSCVAKCAMRLSPALIVRELKAGNIEKAKSFGLMDCIECGCCAFVCPAKVNLIQRIRLGKGIVRQKMAEEKAKAAAKAAAEKAEGGK